MSRIYLRVKRKSLAAEARIIRAEEARAKRQGKTELLNSLNHHRRHVVGLAQRHAQLADAFIRGKPYRSVEQSCIHAGPPSIQLIAENVLRFGKPEQRNMARKERLKEIRNWSEQ